MSHFTTIRTELRDLDILLETLEDLGLSSKGGRVAKGYGGSKRQAEVAVYRSSSFLFRFGRVSPNGPYAVTGLKGVLSRPYVQKLLKKIMQDYGRRKVLKEARKRGFALVRQQVNAGGAMKLVLRKVTTRAA